MPMYVKMTFHGPNTVAVTMRAEQIPMGRAISFKTELFATATLADIKKFWEMERAFNELTKGRLHVELLDEPTA